MLQVYLKRKIHLKTVDTPTATLLVAVLVETYGNETHVSEPKIIRIIPKNTLCISGSVATNLLFSASQEILYTKPSVFPFAFIFSYKNSNNNLTWLYARPPTK